MPPDLSCLFGCVPAPAPACAQVLFYTRMLADIVGRMLPRRKMWAITAPAALLALAGGLLIASVAFFVYLQVGRPLWMS